MLTLYKIIYTTYYIQIVLSNIVVLCTITIMKLCVNVFRFTKLLFDVYSTNDVMYQRFLFSNRLIDLRYGSHLTIGSNSSINL